MSGASRVSGRRNRSARLKMAGVTADTAVHKRKETADCTLHAHDRRRADTHLLYFAGPSVSTDNTGRGYLHFSRPTTTLTWG